MSEQKIKEMLSEWLQTLGFGQMAQDVLNETEWPRIQRYARIILHQIGDLVVKMEVRSRFVMLRLV